MRRDGRAEDPPSLSVLRKNARWSAHVIYGSSEADAAITSPVIVRSLSGDVRCLSDELNDRHYLVVDGVDGRSQ
jgi:hypothetical protein